MKKIFYTTILAVVTFPLFAQVKIGGNSGSTENSAILQIDNANRKGGVLLSPVPMISDLRDKTTPIANPTEGLMVYNPVQTIQTQKEGIYVWINDSWRLLADNNNMVNDLVVQNIAINQNILGTTPNVYTLFDFYTSTLFSNNIPDASYSSSTKMITLPKGGFVVEVNVDFSVLNNIAGTSANIGDGLASIQLLGKLTNAAGTIDYTPEQIESAMVRSNAANTTSDGLASTSSTFIFRLNNSSPTDFVFALANGAGGSYIDSIRVNRVKIHVQQAK